jgi:acylphosphatase
MDRSGLVRRKRTFRGRVQGVGFRYSTQQIASRYQITGYVQNMSDGTVHLVAEGERETVHQFMDDLSQRLGQFIGEFVDETSDFCGEFDDFSIRPTSPL